MVHAREMRGDLVRKPAPRLDLARASGLLPGSLKVGQIALDLVARQHMKSAHQDRGLEHSGLGAIKTLKWPVRNQTHDTTTQARPLWIVFDVNDRKFGMRKCVGETRHRDLL